MISPRQQHVLKLLLHRRQMSRAQLHAFSGIRKMTVSADAQALIRAGIVRECGARRISRGRPEVPLEIDPLRRQVIGVSIRPGHVEAGCSNLLGEEQGMSLHRCVQSPARLVPAARELLRRLISRKTLALGVAVPGFVDPATGSVLMSAAWPGGEAVNLDPIRAAAGDLPVIVENDVHALASRWLLEDSESGIEEEDVLIVFYEDGQVGAALLVNGRPNRGCVVGANELGHTRLRVPTRTCYCGGVGCIERIFSTEFLRHHERTTATLAKAARRFDGTGAGMKYILELFGSGLANAVNFTRVGRVVLVSELNRNPVLSEALIASVRGHMLPVLAQRVRIRTWTHQSRSAQTAAALALAGLYFDGWWSAQHDRISHATAG